MSKIIAAALLGLSLAAASTVSAGAASKVWSEDACYSAEPAPPARFCEKYRIREERAQARERAGSVAK